MAAVMGILFVIVGALLILWGVSAALSATRTTHWPTVSGRVIASRIEVKEQKTLSPSSKGASYYKQKRYYPKIEYPYSVQGKEFTGTKVKALFSGRISYLTEWQAQNVINKYPEGKNVLVFYDPNDPARACLEPGVPWKLVLPMSLFGLLSMGVGIALIFYT